MLGSTCITEPTAVSTREGPRRRDQEFVTDHVLPVLVALVSPDKLESIGAFASRYSRRLKMMIVTMIMMNVLIEIDILEALRATDQLDRYYAVYVEQKQKLVHKPRRA